MCRGHSDDLHITNINVNGDIQTVMFFKIENAWYMSIESIRTRRMKEEEQKNQIDPAKDYPEGYEYENAS